MRRVTGDERRAEREAAYAKNPDQPPIARNARAAAPSPLTQGHGNAARGYRGSGPTPALLMKRPAREPEKV